MNIKRHDEHISIASWKDGCTIAFTSNALLSIKSRHRITRIDNCFDQEAVTKEYKAMSKLVVHYNRIQLIRDNQILYISDLAFLSILVTYVVIGSRQDALLYRIIVI